MSNKRFRRNQTPTPNRQNSAVGMGIGAAVLGLAVFFGTLIFDLVKNPGSATIGVSSIVFAIPAAILGGMVGSLFKSGGGSRRR